MRRLALVLVIALGLAALAVDPARGEPSFPDKTKARITISQDLQQMLIYEDGRLVRTLPASTGWPGIRKTTTPIWTGRIGEYWGTFSSFGTTQDHGYWLFTDYFDDGSWNGDILIHGAPYLPGPTGQKEYERGGIGETPASNGCIRLQPEDAEWFHAWDPVGVLITIEPFTKGTLAFPKLGVGAQLTGTAHGLVPTVEGVAPTRP